MPGKEPGIFVLPVGTGQRAEAGQQDQPKCGHCYRKCERTATGLKEINQAANTMGQGTQQNAAMVEQSTAASQVRVARDGAHRAAGRKTSRFPGAGDGQPGSEGLVQRWQLPPIG